jgi:hypothetical protein
MPTFESGTFMDMDKFARSRNNEDADAVYLVLLHIAKSVRYVTE